MLRALLVEQKGREGANLLFCLSWDIHLLLPWDIGTPGNWAFGLRVELTHTFSSPGSQAIRFGLNYTTRFPGSPTCGQKFMGLLSLHDHMNQFLYSLLYIREGIYIYIYISAIGSVSLGNPV